MCPRVGGGVTRGQWAGGFVGRFGGCVMWVGLVGVWGGVGVGSFKKDKIQFHEVRGCMIGENNGLDKKGTIFR